MELTTGSGGGAPAAGSKGRDETFRMRLSEGSDWIWMRFGGELLPMCLLRRRQWKVSRVRRRRGGDDGDAHVRRGGGGEGGGRYLEDETGLTCPTIRGVFFFPVKTAPNRGQASLSKRWRRVLCYTGCVKAGFWPVNRPIWSLPNELFGRPASQPGQNRKQLRIQ
jgi:hypothetical protein